MIPVIALIGRSNVGKSTLFNILTKSRNALVGNCPGITRDRQYGYCQLEKNKRIILIDTAGLDIYSTEIEKKAQKQTKEAIKESHLILFIVSANDGLMPQEIEIIENIKKCQKKIILIINKTDGINDFDKINEFYSLGIKKIQKISASHNQKINILIKKYLIPWVNLKYKKIESERLHKKEEKSIIKIAFIGCPNAGKSTLINSFLKKERMITCNIPGTTLDCISIPIKYNNKNYILVDTAGISKKRKKNNTIDNFSIIKTLQKIETSNAVLLIIDANKKKICNQDLFLADFIIKSGKSIVIVVNKWDLLNCNEKKILKEQINNKLQFLSFSKIHFISALHQTGIFKIFQSIQEAYKHSNKKISTSMLIKIMKEAIQKHQPPIIKGRRIKLKYAHLGSSNPPKIIIHGNQVKHLSLSYKRYLINYFHEKLQIKGVPIQMQFKDNINPYVKKIKN